MVNLSIDVRSLFLVDDCFISHRQPDKTMLSAKRDVEDFIERERQGKSASCGDDNNVISHQDKIPGDETQVIRTVMDRNSEEKMEIGTMEKFINYMILSDLHDKR